MGPALVVAEYKVVEQLVKLYGWQDGDGIFCPGKQPVLFIALLVSNALLVVKLRTNNVKITNIIYPFSL